MKQIFCQIIFQVRLLSIVVHLYLIILQEKTLNFKKIKGITGQGIYIFLLKYCIFKPMCKNYLKSTQILRF